jgi:hypothetical protein
VPSQSRICTLLPGLPLPLLLSAHLAASTPATIVPVAPLPPAPYRAATMFARTALSVAAGG